MVDIKFSNTYMVFPFWKDKALKILKFIRPIITHYNILIPNEIIRNIIKLYMVYEAESIYAWNICTCPLPACRKIFIEKFSINMDPSIFCNIIHCSDVHCHKIIDNELGFRRCKVCFKYYCNTCAGAVNRFTGNLIYDNPLICGKECNLRLSGWTRC